MDLNPLLAIFALLAATVVLVPLAKAAGLGTILGYLVAGVLIGPYGLKLVSDTEAVRTVSEFGVVMMLFLIGLEVEAAELWRMRNKLLGMGLTQMLITAALIAGLAKLIGFGWPGAIVVGLALAMSSTAIAMQTISSRGLTRTETGRSSLAVLLVQDVAVIPVLAIIPLLASLNRTPVQALGEQVLDAVNDPLAWWTALVPIGGFILALAGSRYVVRPLLRWLALARVPEAFTAFGLALVVGAALLTQSIGLSPALGAFLGGVLLADSEYRHELQGTLEPFKGLLLGLFFISVGMGIAFDAVLQHPFLVLALVMALLALKALVLFGLATVFRLHVAERVLLAVLLAQAGEFAFVVLQFATTAGSMTTPEAQLLAVVVALSMAATPLLLFAYDRVFLPRLNRAAPDPEHPPGPDGVDGHDKVIVLGYGRFGQIITRLLRAQGLEMTLIDDDPAQIELVKRFGVKVFYGDGASLEILRAAGAADARMIVVAVPGAQRILEVVQTIRRNFPKVAVVARAIDRAHAHELMELGVEVFERETFRSAVALGERALVTLGRTRDEAHRIADAFETHDMKLLEESFEVRHDRDAYIGFVKRETEMLDRIMRADRLREPDAEPLPVEPPPLPVEPLPPDIDNGRPAPSE